MLPHKKERGKQAMSRLKVFEGIPPPYDKQKRMVVPDALRVVRLRPGRKFTHLGKLASEVGWKHKDLVSRLEAGRKAKSAEFYKVKKADAAAKAKAAETVSSEISAVLAANGF